MVIDIFNSTEKYGLILADPPWKQSKGGKKAVRKNSSGMELDYPVCSLDEIKSHLEAATKLTEKTQFYFFGQLTNICLKRNRSQKTLGTSFTQE